MAILAGRPKQVSKEDSSWAELTSRAAEELEEARIRSNQSKEKNRRGEFTWIRTGVSHGNGRKRPMNFNNSPRQQEIIEDLNGRESFRRISGFTNSKCLLSPFIHSNKRCGRCFQKLDARPSWLLCQNSGVLAHSGSQSETDLSWKRVLCGNIQPWAQNCVF